MRVLAEYGKEDLAKVYVASMRDDNRYLVEFVESLQPPIPREKKWVLIVSTLYGCPVGCKICDADGRYLGKLSTEEILEEIDCMIRKRFPDGRVPIPKFKIQFARMGEPSLNPNVLEVLENLPKIYNAPGLIPCISTIAPAGSEEFFERLLDIKSRLYPQGRFQLQFSINTTDDDKSHRLMPINRWSFAQISDYGKRFFKNGDRKIALNFAAIRDYPIDFRTVREYFDPEIFLIKLTPLNPTKKALENKLVSAIDPYSPQSAEEILEGFRSVGFDVILSIGEVEENGIGSNCGQFVSAFEKNDITIRDGYQTDRYRIGKLDAHTGIRT